MKLDHVQIHLGDRQLVAVDATIAKGEVLTIMGPSGSGKSTLINLISGHLAPAFRASGKVIIDQDILHLPPHKRRVGVLFQDDLLFPHLSVGQNLMFGIAGGRRKERALAMLSEIGMDRYFDADPATLSGGQKARVALARMLLSDPKALLLDEPFSKLDAELRAQIRQLVFDRAKALGLPVLLVTHDKDDVPAGGRIITL